MVDPVSPALTPAAAPAVLPPVAPLQSAKAAKVAKPAKKSAPPPRGDQFDSAYGAGRQHCVALSDTSAVGAEPLRKTKNLLFAPLYKGYHTSHSNPDQVTMGHDLSMEEAAGFWYPLPVLARDSTNLARPVVLMLQTSHDITENDCPDVDFIRLVYAVYGNNESWSDGTLRTIMYDLPPDHGYALSANVFEYTKLHGEWCKANLIDYQVRYVLACMQRFGSGCHGWPSVGRLSVRGEPFLLQKALAKQLASYRGFARCRLLVVDGLEKNDKKDLQTATTIQVADLARRCNDAYVNAGGLMEAVRAMAKGKWGNDPAALTQPPPAAASAQPAAGGATFVCSVNSSDSESSTSVKRAAPAPTAASSSKRPPSKKARREEEASEAELTSGGGSDSQSSDSEDDSEEEEEEEDSEEEELDEDSDDEPQEPKSAGMPKAAPAAKKAAPLKAPETQPAQPKESKQASSKKGAERGKRRPAMNRRNKLLQVGRDALELLQQLRSVPSEFEQKLRDSVTLTKTAISDYVEEGHVEEQSELIGALCRMVMFLAEILTSMGAKGAPQPPDSVASRRAATLMSGLFAAEQPVLESFSSSLTDLLDKLSTLTDHRRKTVRESEQVVSTMTLARNIASLAGNVRVAAHGT